MLFWYYSFVVYVVVSAPVFCEGEEVDLSGHSTFIILPEPERGLGGCVTPLVTPAFVGATLPLLLLLLLLLGVLVLLLLPAASDSHLVSA